MYICTSVYVCTCVFELIVERFEGVWGHKPKKNNNKIHFRFAISKASSPQGQGAHSKRVKLSADAAKVVGGCRRKSESENVSHRLQREI